MTNNSLVYLPYSAEMKELCAKVEEPPEICPTQSGSTPSLKKLSFGALFSQNCSDSPQFLVNYLGC